MAGSNCPLARTSGEVAETRVGWPRDVAGEPGRYYWRVVAVLEERGETRHPW